MPGTRIRFTLLLLILAALIAKPAFGQSCNPRLFGGSALRLLNYTDDTSETSLGPFRCDLWTLPQSTLDDDDACVLQDNGRTYLLFEFWRLDTKFAVDSRSLENIYFLVARGAQPNVTYVGSSDVVYNPPLSPQPQLGQNGTMRDADGDQYWRPYHRIIVPYNTSSYIVGSKDWFITVANMELQYSVLRYTVRVSCVAEASVPCPRPSPSGGECSGKGSCGNPPQGVVRPALNRVCTCAPGMGDYGCQTPAPMLGDGDVTSAVLDSGKWAFWQIRLPLPPSGVKPSLLVELSRSAVGFGSALGGFGVNANTSGVARYGGDPVLMLMPKDSDGSNRLPWFTDITAYADLRSYFLQQNFHYVLTRDLSAGAAAGGGNAAEFYVAVFNNDQRFSRDPQLLYPQANVTLRVRWRTSSGVGSSDPPLCPNDCYGQGTCYDPLDGSTGNLPTSILPAVATYSAKPADFLCGCLKEYGGTLCEGKLRNLTVSYAGDGGTGSLAPGQWAYYVLSFDPRRFDYRSDVVAIQWAVSDGTYDPPTAYANAYLTIDENAFPRNAQLDSDDPFRRGWQIFYNSLVLRSNPPQPLQMKGSDLKPGYNYVLGVYNSDYVRKMPFDYGLSVYVPSASRTWLHPYMSVVLGVTASIILCLFMTLCRRLVQRYGWGPFRSRDPLANGPNGNVARIQVAQMASRQQGVPSHIIDTFNTYQYTATKAEKVQLARSRRDHDAEMQRQASLQPQGSLQQQGSVQRQGSLQRQVGGTAAATDGHRCSNPDCKEEHLASASVTAMASATVTAADTAVQATGPIAAASVPLVEPSTSAAPAAAVALASNGAAAQGGDDDDEPQCTVCLCEYEEGERITQLPCKHEFHSTCINKWLQTHYTCPICRVSLLPEQPEGEHEEGARPDAPDARPQQQVDGTPTSDGPGAAVVAWPVGAVATGAAGTAAMQSSLATGAATDPAAPSTAAAAGPPSQPGILARMLGSMRRGAPQPPAQVTGLEEMPQQHLQEQEPAPQRVQRSSSARGVAEAVVQPEPAPASLVATYAGDYGTVVAATPPGTAQLLARGPSAVLEPGRSGSSGGGSSASRVSASARLAAGRLASPPRSPLALGAVIGSAGSSPNRVHPMPITPLRDEPLLAERMDIDVPEPPGLSPSGHR